MNRRDAIFPCISAIIPLLVNELINNMLDISNPAKYQKIMILILSTVLSFVILMIAASFLEQHFLTLNKYCGQWIEEMTCIDNTGKAITQYIGIGIIRYDRKTKEHTFIGKTYDLSGTEKYSWTIDYLRSDKDNSMQYICGVHNPNEMSIGRLTFSSKNECRGNIWVMNGISYTFNSYRITNSLAKNNKIPVVKPTLFNFLSNKRVIIGQQNCPAFVQEYVKSVWPK